MKHSQLATLILFLLLACAPTPASVPQTAGVTGAVTATPQVAIVTPTHAPTATRTAVPTATRTPKPPAAAKFTDGARTMSIDSGVVRVGVDKDWGGAIREIWFNGQNLVNNWDGGRLIGVSIYDGDAKGGWQVNIPDWGWNPGPSDKHNNVNTPITYSFDNGILYVKARCLQWNPDDKGGGKGHPVSTDAVVETWIKFVSDDPHAINVRYRVTYGGPDSHALAGQEMGFAYIRTPFNRFVTYAGNAPWTGALPRVETLSPFQDTGVNVGRETAATEQWAGFVNSEDVGLSVWAPQSYPIFSRAYFPTDHAENSTYYMSPRAFFTVAPGFSYEMEVFLFAGKWQEARALFNLLRQEVNLPDVMPTFGNVDVPAQNRTVSGTVAVSGWAIDNRGVAKVEVFLDGTRVGQATYGLAREDVDRDYPGLTGAPNFGFVYQLNTRASADGSHVLEVRASDTAGNTSLLRPGKVTINIRN